MILNPIVDAIVHAIEGISKGVTNSVVYGGNGVGNMSRTQGEKAGDAGARGTDRVFEGTLQAVPKVVKSAATTTGVVYDSVLAGIKKVFKEPISFVKSKAMWAAGKVKSVATKAASKV